MRKGAAIQPGAAGTKDASMGGMNLPNTNAPTVDHIQPLGPQSTADDALDEGLLETFPASDAIAVGMAYGRRDGMELARRASKGVMTWPFP